ncbi:MAG: hypothetical protein R3F37_23320 [Candidatus Competibacteraceae bacterium]
MLTCFAGIASLLIALRTGGAQVGWGFQLQSPIFVTLLAYLMFAVGLSLSGAFTVGGSLMGLRQRLGGAWRLFRFVFHRRISDPGGHPCSAPFMGAALGFALTQPWPSAGDFRGVGVWAGVSLSGDELLPRRVQVSA